MATQSGAWVPTPPLGEGEWYWTCFLQRLQQKGEGGGFEKFLTDTFTVQPAGLQPAFWPTSTLEVEVYL